MVLKIEGKNDVCLSGCSSITEAARIMGLALFERAGVNDCSNYVYGGDTPLSFGAMGL